MKILTLAAAATVLLACAPAEAGPWRHARGPYAHAARVRHWGWGPRRFADPRFYGGYTGFYGGGYGGGDGGGHGTWGSGGHQTLTGGPVGGIGS